MITDSIPVNAIKITFVYTECHGYYHIWQKSGNWFWAGMGSNGEERTQEEACQSARNWIKDNFNKEIR